MKKIIKKICFWLSFCGNIVVFAIVTPPMNLFTPYDRLMTPPISPCVCWQVYGGYEGVLSQRSFQADEDEFGNFHCFRKRADVLQLYQDEQDLLAALKGSDFTTALAQLAQKFNIDDDNGLEGLFIPSGTFDVNNFMLSARRFLNYGFSVSAHLQILSMKLKEVSWRPSPQNSLTGFDGNVTDDFVAAVEAAGDINLYNWERKGVGDIAALVWWEQDFPQARPLLKNVNLGLRTGLLFPTGKQLDEDVMLGVPFGGGAGVGILGAGTLEMSFCSWYLFGIDAELTYLFGKTRSRRIKTDPAQTDLTFLTKACVYTEPGVLQHFTLYGRFDHFVGGVSAQVAYQYTKQQDTDIFFGTSKYDVAIARRAESLESWTNHSVVFSFDFDFCNSRNEPGYNPYLSVFYKHGFNGSRAVLFDTMGCLLAVDF
jgi:hypothetical protein